MPLRVGSIVRLMLLVIALITVRTVLRTFTHSDAPVRASDAASSDGDWAAKPPPKDANDNDDENDNDNDGDRDQHVDRVDATNSGSDRDSRSGSDGANEWLALALTAERLRVVARGRVGRIYRANTHSSERVSFSWPIVPQTSSAGRANPYDVMPSLGEYVEMYQPRMLRELPYASKDGQLGRPNSDFGAVLPCGRREQCLDALLLRIDVAVLAYKRADAQHNPRQPPNYVETFRSRPFEEFDAELVRSLYVVRDTKRDAPNRGRIAGEDENTVAFEANFGDVSKGACLALMFAQQNDNQRRGQPRRVSEECLMVRARVSTVAKCKIAFVGASE